MSEHPDVAEQAVIGAILLEPERIKKWILQVRKEKTYDLKKGIN